MPLWGRAPPEAMTLSASEKDKAEAVREADRVAQREVDRREAHGHPPVSLAVPGRGWGGDCFGPKVIRRIRRDLVEISSELGGLCTLRQEA